MNRGSPDPQTGVLVAARGAESWARAREQFFGVIVGVKVLALKQHTEINYKKDRQWRSLRESNRLLRLKILRQSNY